MALSSKGKSLILSIAITTILFCTSCNKTSETEGGPNSPVSCLYEFNHFDEYIEFYDTFKINNDFRFYAPKDASENNIKYLFSFVEKRKTCELQPYGIEFWLPSLNIEYAFDGLVLIGQCNALSNHIDIGDLLIQCDVLHNQTNVSVTDFVGTDYFCGTIYSTLSNNQITNLKQCLLLDFNEGKSYVS